MEAKPIPALYVCYLLRSKVSPENRPIRWKFYIGSTPDPQRRLAQHNGIAKGGAVRTSRHKDWQMTCAVTGFPSNVAALQFEWAWQKTHLTLRVLEEDRNLVRLAPPKSPTKDVKTKEGRKRKRPKQPFLSLDRGLSNLYALLRAPSFSRLPLRVLFFYGDVYEAWRKKCTSLGQEVQDDSQSLRDPFGISLLLAGQREFEAIDASYSSLLPWLEKSQQLLANAVKCRCTICNGTIDNQGMALTCSTQQCTMISHMTCLSQLFLKEDSLVLPISGDCPRCKTRLEWIDLVKELTLRTRGPLTVEKLKRRAKRQRLKGLGSEAANASDMASESSEQEDATDIDNTDSDPSSTGPADHVSSLDDVVDPFGEDAWNDWRHIAGEDDAMSNIEGAHGTALSLLRLSLGTQSKSSLPMVIEDSECDSAEALD